MGNPRILIVDDEEAVLKILSDSLKKQREDYEIITATDGYTALEYLSQTHFELVITDYKMAGMDGLELLEAIRDIQPDTRVILITAYGNDAIEAEARRLQAYKYLAKPLQITTFRQIVDEALSDMAISRPGILILSDERYRLVVHLLQDLQGNVGARCVFLANSDGNIVARTGVTKEFPIEQVSSLLGGGLAALFEAGRVIDGDSEAINMAYREGNKECLYAINIGEQIMLLLVIERGPYSSRIGSVWYYTQQAVVTLRKTLGEADFASPQQVFDEHVEEAFDRELDELFSEKHPEGKVHDRPAPSDFVEIWEESSEEDDSSLFSFSEAIEAGLISENLGDEGNTGNAVNTSNPSTVEGEDLEGISSG